MPDPHGRSITRGVSMSIGLRDDRLNERCVGCKRRSAMQDWCDKYRENRNYCVVTCIQDHPDCPRDHPAVKKQIKFNQEVEQSMVLTVDIGINETTIHNYCARRLGPKKKNGMNEYEVYCPPDSLEGTGFIIGKITHRYEDGANILALKILNLVVGSKDQVSDGGTTS